MSDYGLIYESFGAGVQSTFLLVASALGIYGVPRADVAIFADTGDEPAWVYEHLHFMEQWSGDRGIPVKRVSLGVKLSDRLVSAARGERDGKQKATIPGFTKGPDGKRGV